MREAAAIGLEVGDRLLRDAGLHRRLGDSDGHDPDQPRIERLGNDVLAAEARADAAIGRSDRFRHVLAGKLGQGLGGGDLHFVVDAGRAHVERAAENEGEAEDVVDLVRIIASGRWR